MDTKDLTVKNWMDDKVIAQIIASITTKFVKKDIMDSEEYHFCLIIK